MELNGLMACNEERLPSNSRLELETPTWNYYYVGQTWGLLERSRQAANICY